MVVDVVDVVVVEVEVDAGTEVLVAKVDGVVTIFTGVVNRGEIAGICTLGDFFQMSFPRTLAQTNGARLVPESKPALEHFWPALAAETDSDGKATNVRNAIMLVNKPNFVFIALPYSTLRSSTDSQ